MNLWKPYQPSAKAPWSLRRVVHLHRRAGFAAPWRILQRDLADGSDVAVKRLIDGESQPTSDLVGTIGDAAIASNNPQRLKAWWLYRMVSTRDPLRERLTLMWHNYFATSNRKVKNLAFMREQNELFREHGRGKFGKLLSAVVKHPATLIWLDADSNRKGHANENLARELMELFTIGVGNYTEQDVKDAARALTGWTVIGDRFQYRENRHDDGHLMILGESKPFDGDELLELLLNNPATAKRLAMRICKTFMGEDIVGDEATQELANGLMQNQLDIGWAVDTVLNSQLFFSADNIRSKVIGPVEFLIGSIRCLDLAESPPSSMVLAQWLMRMGQDLFYPPNVGGWNEGRSWLSSRTIVARANFVDALCRGALWSPQRIPDFESFAETDGVADTLEEQVSWLCQLFWGKADLRIVKETVETLEPKDRSLSRAMLSLMSRPENQLG